MDQVSPVVVIAHQHQNHLRCTHHFTHADSWPQTTDIRIKISGEDHGICILNEFIRFLMPAKDWEPLLLINNFQSGLHIPWEYEDNPVGKIIEIILICMLIEKVRRKKLIVTIFKYGLTLVPAFIAHSFSIYWEPTMCQALCWGYKTE